MIPILFNYNATSFTTHGIGDLRDTIACETIVNSEGEYELELQYPVGGDYIGSLTYNNIIVAKADDHSAYQAFRIYGVSKAINSIVTVKAQHLSYDLSCVPVINYEATKCSAAINGLSSHAVGTGANLFNFYTDIPDSRQAENQDREFKMEEPLTLRAALLDGDDSIYGCWGGDLVFDNYSVKLLNTAGADRGVLIEYGIDMIDMEQEENISEMITGVFPYWKGREEGDDADADDKIVCGSVQYVYWKISEPNKLLYGTIPASSEYRTFDRQRIIPLNVTDYYPNNTSSPTAAEIEQTACDWMRANDTGRPVINLKISYAELGKDVRLHDAITVRFVKIGIDVKAKVISYRYDVLKERCIEIEVGSVKPSILFSLEDASRLKRGLIPPKRIANNSINSDMIQNYGVGENNLGSGSVGTRSIQDDAVKTEKINDWAITTDKLGDMVVTTAKVKDGNITSGKISDNAIITGKIANGAVVEAKIGNSAITSAKIQDGAVINAKVGAAAISTEKVQNLAIESAKIGNSAITSVKIENGAVVNGKIGNFAVDYPKIKNAEIDQLKLNDYSVTSAKVDEGGYHENPDGSYEYRSSPAIVYGKIGDEQVYQYHLEEHLNGTIEAVATFENLVASHIDTDGVITCSALTCNGTYMLPRPLTIPSSTGGDPVTVTVLAAISDGW